MLVMCPVAEFEVRYLHGTYVQHTYSIFDANYALPINKCLGRAYFHLLASGQKYLVVARSAKTLKFLIRILSYIHNKAPGLNTFVCLPFKLGPSLGRTEHGVLSIHLLAPNVNIRVCPFQRYICTYVTMYSPFKTLRYVCNVAVFSLIRAFYTLVGIMHALTHYP
jgi:hypothetical protein